MLQDEKRRYSPTILNEEFQKKIEDKQRELFGERYVGKSLCEFQAQECSQVKLFNFVANPKNFLVYLGNTGIGKTFFCASLMEFAICDFKTFRYWKEGALLSRVRRSIDEFPYSDYLETLNHLIDDDLIFLDDVGSTGMNDWREEILFSAIDYRYNSMKPTIITSNLSIAQFRKNYHERICSRLFASENTVIEILNGLDKRTVKN